MLGDDSVVANKRRQTVKTLITKTRIRPDYTKKPDFTPAKLYATTRKRELIIEPHETGQNNLFLLLTRRVLARSRKQESQITLAVIASRIRYGIFIKGCCFGSHT